MESFAAGPKARRGWTGLSVLGLMAAAGLAVGWGGGYLREDRGVKGREYSNPGKWNQPKYATLQDMKAVSDSEVGRLGFGQLLHSYLLKTLWELQGASSLRSGEVKRADPVTYNPMWSDRPTFFSHLLSGLWVPSFVSLPLTKS